MGNDDVYIIGDLHLSPDDESRKDAFVDFAGSIRGARSLYVLGDFFEIWTGPESLDEEAFEEVFRALRELSASGTRITFILGNRDFLLGSREKRALGIHEILDDALVELGRHRVHLSHGDLFCSRDRHYQGYRRAVRSVPIRTILRMVPRRVARSLGGQMRKRSEDIVKHKGERMTDIVMSEVYATFDRTGADVVVCGHVHREYDRTLTRNNKAVRFLTLGAWNDRAEGIVFRNGRFERF